MTWLHPETLNVNVPRVDCDVLVVGSGAGGLSAAVTAAYHGLKVVVVEKADVCGGATSWSGGWAWTPGNPLAKADGVNEDRELFRTYLRHRLGGNYHDDKVDAFLEAVPRHGRLLPRQDQPAVRAGRQDQGHLRQHARRRAPGTGRWRPKPFNARRIRPEVRAKMRHQLYETSFLGMGIMAGPDLHQFLSASRAISTGIVPRRLAGRAPRLLDLVTHRRNMQLVNGTALTGRLLKSADDLGVDIRVSTPRSRLLTDAHRKGDRRARGRAHRKAS